VNEAGSVGGGIVFIDAHTGLWQKKILALRFTNIDWLNGEVAASKAVAKFSAEDGTHMWVWKIGPPKAQKSNRGVALPQSAIEPLSELRQTTKDPAGLLFPGPDLLLQERRDSGDGRVSDGDSRRAQRAASNPDYTVH
jgi:integrase